MQESVLCKGSSRIEHITSAQHYLWWTHGCGSSFECTYLWCLSACIIWIDFVDFWTLNFDVISFCKTNITCRSLRVNILCETQNQPESGDYPKPKICVIETKINSVKWEMRLKKGDWQIYDMRRRSIRISMSNSAISIRLIFCIQIRLIRRAISDD